MDLGGASTQITFETASPAEDPDNEVQLRLYGQLYRVYTHSFLCYGRDQVLRRLLASALQVPPPAHLHHSAFLEGGSKGTWAKGAEQSRDSSHAEGCSRQREPVAFTSWQDGTRRGPRPGGRGCVPGRGERRARACDAWPQALGLSSRQWGAGDCCWAQRRSHKGDLWEVPQAGPPEALRGGLEAGAVQPTPSRFPQTHGFHPCWPRGYSTQVPLRDLYASPCTAAQRPQTFNSSDRVHLEGGSDPALCRGLVSGLFNFSSCRFSRCSFNGVFQPPVSGDFMVSPGDGVGPLPCSAWGLGTPGLYPPPRPSRPSSTPWTS